MFRVVILAVSLLVGSCSSASIQAVGPPVVVAPPHPQGLAPRKSRLIVVNWNVHVGHGDILKLVRSLTEREAALGFASPDLVLLLQESFRRGTEVPSPENGSAPRRIAPPASAMDIEDTARELGWWMYYAPSMRNGNGHGEMAEDRGNAILSSLPLSDFEAVELPFVVQRRVALMATVADPANRVKLRVAVAHLDTRAPLRQGWIFGGPAARTRQAHGIVSSLDKQPSGEPLVLGADLNTQLGGFEGAVETLSEVAPRLACGAQATHRSGLVLDHVFAVLPGEWSRATCERLDTTFGSDHYPLVLSIPLA